MQETYVSDFDCSDFDDEGQMSDDIPLERWAPLGAASVHSESARFPLLYTCTYMYYNDNNNDNKNRC